jgi:hypothetical protein
MPTRCIQIKDGKIVNVILADPAEFDPGDGSTVVACEAGDPGDLYENGVITPAPEPISGDFLIGSDHGRI